VWAITEGFRPYPQAAVHAFCHALPGRWHQMAVTLSVTASLAWWSSIAGGSEAELLAEMPGVIAAPSEAVFLPYLSGERTPHNDGGLRGLFAGLSAGTDRVAMTQGGVSPELNEVSGWRGAPWRWLFSNPQGTGWANKRGLKFTVAKDGRATTYRLTK